MGRKLFTWPKSTNNKLGSMHLLQFNIYITIASLFNSYFATKLGFLEQASSTSSRHGTSSSFSVFLEFQSLLLLLLIPFVFHLPDLFLYLFYLVASVSSVMEAGVTCLLFFRSITWSRTVLEANWFICCTRA